MAHPASDFERYERDGDRFVFESVGEATPQPFDARLARARFLSLMEQAAAAALYEGRDIDDVECERWVEISEAIDGPWRLELLDNVVQLNEAGLTRPLFMRAARLRGTIVVSDHR